MFSVAKRISRISFEQVSVNNIVGYKDQNHVFIPLKSSHQIAVECFYEFSLLPLYDKVRDSLLDIMVRERKGESGHTFVIKNIFEIYKTLSYFKVEILEEIYCFILSKLKEYYKVVCDQYLSSKVSDYLQKVSQCLQFEDESLYYQELPELKFKVKNLILDIFVKDKMNYLLDQFEIMINEDNVNDMSNFYIIFSLINGALIKPSNQFKDFLITKGNEIVAEGSNALKTKKDIKLCGPFIEKLIEFSEKYYNLIETTFNKSSFFIQAYDHAFKRILNNDIGFLSMPEVLDIYIDMVMKGVIKVTGDDIIDKLFDNILKIFSYFDDRDFFYKAYQKSLSRRLISGSYNDNLETTLIHKLKMNVADTLITSIEAMYNDINISTENMSIFKERISEDPLNFDVNVLVLNSSHWPVKKQKELEILGQFHDAINKYTSFFLEKNEKKELVWITDGSTVILNHYLIDDKGREKKVECHVSMLQASILLLFNDEMEHSFLDIHQILEIPKAKLKSVIVPLINNPTLPLLKIVNRNTKDGKSDIVNNGDNDNNESKESSSKDPRLRKKRPAEVTIEDSDVFALAGKKQSKLNRIKYRPSSSQSISDESKMLKDKVLEERKIFMDLALVRVMKTRKKLHFHDLIKEASQNLMKFFTPDVKLIKRRIEELIEKEYMRRDDDDRNTLHYVA